MLKQKIQNKSTVDFQTGVFLGVLILTEINKNQQVQFHFCGGGELVFNEA
jgi:hypothetical protein